LPDAVSPAAFVALAAAAIRESPTLWRAARPRAAAGADPLGAALDWLPMAQRACGGGGFAHSFHLLQGWRPAYPETTGYIVASLRRAWQREPRAELLSAIAAAARWLASVQQPDGSFLDLAGRAQVFDTAQILYGWNDLAAHLPDLVARDRQARAAAWIAAQQEADGSFHRHAYNAIPHSYYARVGAALLAAGRLLDDARLREAGLRNLRWVLAQQEANGAFRYMSFDASPPFLHTMIYVAEGLLDGHQATGDGELLAALLRYTGALLATARRDRTLRSQYDAGLAVANGELCLTGLAQWAGLCLRLAALGHADYAGEGRRTLDLLKRQQLFCADPRLNGGLPGSAPFWGRYMRLSIPNWGVKFFIDALLEAG
jgi:hypothetical protein